MLKNILLYFKDRGGKNCRKKPQPYFQLDLLVCGHFFPCSKQGLDVGCFAGMRVFSQSRCPSAAPLTRNGGMQHLYITGVPNTSIFP